jgi:hypothetical protein
MKKCAYCGINAYDDANFCQKCGGKVEFDNSYYASNPHQQFSPSYAQPCDTSQYSSERPVFCDAGFNQYSSDNPFINNQYNNNQQNSYAEQQHDPYVAYYHAQQELEKAQREAGSAGWGVLGFFFPLIGFILWLIWRGERNGDARYAGIGALINVIVSVALFIIFFAVLIAVLPLYGSYYYLG